MQLVCFSVDVFAVGGWRFHKARPDELDCVNVLASLDSNLALDATRGSWPYY